MVDAAQRLAAALDSSVRMALLEALSDAAAEITAALDGVSVEVRLRGREPDLVVDQTDAYPAPDGVAVAGLSAPTAVPALAGAADDATARLTLRLPDGLKQRAEGAAGTARLSLNTWLVDAVRAALDVPPTDAGGGRGRGRDRPGKQLSGWAR